MKKDEVKQYLWGIKRKDEIKEMWEILKRRSRWEFTISLHIWGNGCFIVSIDGLTPCCYNNKKR